MMMMLKLIKMMRLTMMMGMVEQGNGRAAVQLVKPPPGVRALTIEINLIPILFINIRETIWRPKCLTQDIGFIVVGVDTVCKSIGPLLCLFTVVRWCYHCCCCWLVVFFVIVIGITV